MLVLLREQKTASVITTLRSSLFAPWGPLRPRGLCAHAPRPAGPGFIHQSIGEVSFRARQPRAPGCEGCGSAGRLSTWSECGTTRWRERPAPETGLEEGDRREVTPGAGRIPLPSLSPSIDSCHLSFHCRGCLPGPPHAPCAVSSAKCLSSFGWSQLARPPPHR